MVGYPKIVLQYQTTWFPITLDDIDSHFTCLKPLRIQYCGKLGCSYMIISVIGL